MDNKYVILNLNEDLNNDKSLSYFLSYNKFYKVLFEDSTCYQLKDNTNEINTWNKKRFKIIKNIELAKILYE